MFSLRKRLSIYVFCTGVFLAIVCSLWSKSLWSESCGGRCDVKANRCPTECSACTLGKGLDRQITVCQKSSSTGTKSLGQIYSENELDTIAGMFSGNLRYPCTSGYGLDNTYHIKSTLLMFDTCYKFFCNGGMLEMKQVHMDFCPPHQPEVCPKPEYRTCKKGTYPIVCSYDRCLVSEKTGKVEWNPVSVEQDYDAQRWCYEACPELYKPLQRDFAQPPIQDNRETCAPEGWHCTEEDRSYWRPDKNIHEYTCLYTVCANGHKADEKGSQSGRCPTQCATVKQIQYPQQ